MALSRASARICDPSLHTSAPRTPLFAGSTPVSFATVRQPVSSASKAINESCPSWVCASRVFGLAKAPLLESSRGGGRLNSKHRTCQLPLRAPLCVCKSQSSEVMGERVGKMQCCASGPEHFGDAGERDAVSKETKVGRRNVLELVALTVLVGSTAAGASPAHAYKPPPEGEV